MQRAGRCGDSALAHRAQVVGVDLLAQTHLALGVDAQVRRRAADGFRKSHGRPAVQYAARLPGVLVHRHGGRQEIRADLRKADPQVLNEGASRALLQLFEGHRVAPNTHGSVVYCR
jgi:hypothetical protein